MFRIARGNRVAPVSLPALSKSNDTITRSQRPSERCWPADTLTRDCVSPVNRYTAASLITPLAPIVPIVAIQSSRSKANADETRSSSRASNFLRESVASVVAANPDRVCQFSFQFRNPERRVICAFANRRVRISLIPDENFE